MRWLALALAAVMCCSGGAWAQDMPPQRRAAESDSDWSRRLYQYAAAPGLSGAEFQRRTQSLPPADRRLVMDHGKRIVSAHLRCQQGSAEACAERASLVGTTHTPRQPTVRPGPAAPPPLSPEQQDALQVWNALYPGLNSRRPDPDPRVWLRYSPEERSRMVEQCVRLRRAADVLGPNYTRLQPCPPLAHFEGAAETVRRAEIAETERINAARAAARSAAIANSGSGLVTVRTYDANGNYTGDRTVTRSQAESLGARPQ